MKAVTFTKYGSPAVLALRDVEKPTPQDNEVLIKVRAASVNAGDWHLMRGAPFLIRLYRAGDAKGLRPPDSILMIVHIVGELPGQPQLTVHQLGTNEVRPYGVGLRWVRAGKVIDDTATQRGFPPGPERQADA